MRNRLHKRINVSKHALIFIHKIVLLLNEGYNKNIKGGISKNNNR